MKSFAVEMQIYVDSFIKEIYKRINVNKGHHDSSIVSQVFSPAQTHKSSLENSGAD